MGDPLAAFFAKKAQKKSKKKSVVSLDDVGQQLERRVRIQENGEGETDENEVKEPKSNENVKLTQSSEDSEWIEHNEKPSLVGLTFKEYNENSDELLEENKKRANNESAKTWQMKSEVRVEPPKPIQPKTYQAPFARRDARLDINNEEMFPSIAAADEIVEKLKVEEKKKSTTTVIPVEEQFQEAKKFRSRALEESIGTRTPTTGSSHRSDVGVSERTQRYAPRNITDSSEDRAWRNTNISSGRANFTATAPQDEGNNWRSKSSLNTPRTTEVSQEASSNWRSSKPAAQSAASPAMNAPLPNAQPKTNKYVPPSLRGKT